MGIMGTGEPVPDMKLGESKGLDAEHEAPVPE